MESLRHQLLQAELTRIEQEAEAKSYAIMNKADVLATAHTFCEKINEGLSVYLKFRVTVLYQSQGCNVVIYTHDNSDVFLRRAAELGAAWADMGQAFDATRRIRFDGAPGIDVFVLESAIAQAETLKAAA